MYCPTCNFFANNTLICVNCGNNFPQPRKPKWAKSRAHGSENRSYMKVILILLLVGAVYGLYTKYFQASDFPSVGIISGIYTSRSLPSYMIDGPVNLEKKIVKGRTNIIDFYSEYCPPCKRIAPFLKKLEARREDIVVIKIDINRIGVEGIDWDSPVAKQFKLKSIPYFIVISPWGKLICEGKEGYNYLIQQLKAAGLA
ncbi:MAG TPA: thioredoxin [Candidatus Aminicenantes bacterium]|nr:thioredoxin [Candidatus Aminicenantes bacterium]